MIILGGTVAYIVRHNSQLDQLNFRPKYQQKPALTFEPVSHDDNKKKKFNIVDNFDSDFK